ncbi:MAG: hypothetical protein UU05_C0001G0027 [Candidatus Curtissbacteria bacterium GW2011_GWA1_40_47]|uniref:Glycosyltransferase RgtA/B/C/D-like domain-containing protein n=1 Tax=Candidatus Curtissbacteria bacterium RIFOXYA1_FULL_41_14 TaxID=1797737 RepID=A0A1F5HAK0_9BACT|nr:MAG: hypothetical protein UT95_C0001G0110 [Candidatus Curtissbacteria bacterium GW2011_GWB1_40_28]KKR62396.1 MAG: hypothetical protein UU00_C0001G0116 [Microgenomates group bacterium GW2011_GWC1_40_35]KKR66403.1 MAG: hypothetical protein UU05_C0001G0027 [Candidatus Curtissbacteria bacterium GW2011_GWA1_40_47]KKR75595.1 MAG: hypothetical protein UU19_C0054G0002 [Candidatus Curtissbacteria bacterium GW2011_GWD1_40_8]KKS02564.1 MAG: hypothetical protein UU53_C0001G0109 [Candidatus Curtissbacter
MLLLVPLLLLIHFVLLINTRFTLWPEMVVYPYLVNNGFMLYRDIINPYPPFLSYSLAIFAKIFGYQPLPYQILTWFLIIITDLLTFLLAQKIFTKSTAYFSLIFFIILSIPFGVNGLWFDLVQTPLVLLSVYFFYKFMNNPKSRKSLFFSVFSLTIAIFTKQQVIWLSLWFLAILIYKFGKKTKDIFIKNPYIFAPFICMFLTLIIFFRQQGLTDDFLYWIFIFPFFKASRMPWYLLLPTVHQILTILALFFLFTPILFNNRFKTTLIVLTGFVLVLFAYPRFDYFHLIPSLTVLSLTFPDNLKSLKKTKLAIRSIFTLSLIFLIVFTIRYLKNNWTQEVRFFEKDIAGAALTLSKNTNPGDSIYIQNGPDQILALSGRLPPKPWADEFPWYLEIPDLQKKVIDGIEKQNSKFIIFKPYDVGPRYELGVYRPREIADYLDANYKNLVQISDTLWFKVRK